MPDVYINANAGTNGTGTSGSPYNSWANFLTGEARDLTSGAEGVLNVYIQGTLTDPNANTGQLFTLAGFTVDSSNYVHLQPWSGFEGDGTWDSAPGFSHESDSGFAQIFDLLAHCDLTGLQVKNTRYTVDSSGYGARFLGNNIVDGAYIRAGTKGAMVRSNVALRSNLIKCEGNGNGVEADGTFLSGIQVDYCTLIGSSSGTAIVNASNCTITVRDTVTYGWTTEYATNSGTWGSGSTNNAGETATASQPANIQTNYVDLTGDPFVSSGTGDYTPATSGQLDDAGTALAGITTDIVGTTRDASTPDIGAIETTGGGGGPSTPQGLHGIGRGINVQRSTRLGGELEFRHAYT